jgi:hypothetical protein
MDSSFKTELVKDSTIADITPELTFSVESGAANTTFQRFTSTSPSNSSVIFSVQLPSESIIMSRDILLRTGLSFRIGATVGATEVANQPVCIFGVDTALQAFPFASLITTANCQINNTSVSVNLQDILPQLLQMNDKSYLSYFNGMCPSLPDGDYAQYTAAGDNNNVLAGYGTASYDNHLLPRGAHPLILTATRTINGVVTTPAQPWLTSGTGFAESWVITVQTIVTEPVFLSPFTFAAPERNAMGMVGLNNLAFTFNIDATLKRLLSTSSPFITAIVAGTAANPNLFQQVSTLQLGSVTIPELLLKFLSSQPTDLIATKNVVPYTDMPRYISQSAGGTLGSGLGAQVVSQNIQLNQIPSKFLICVRPQMSSQDFSQTSTFMCIRDVSVNLNNSSGLLSSATTQDLWRMSVKNGSNQTWSQFSGVTQAIFAGSSLNETTGGSLLVLNPAYDLSLPNYISNGSLGQYNFQINLTIYNQFGSALVPEIVIVCVNDGILTTSQGTSTTFTGILTKQLVLDTMGQKAMSSSHESRLIGGAMLNSHRFRKGGVTMGGVASGGAMSAGARCSGSRLSGMLR